MALRDSKGRFVKLSRKEIDRPSWDDYFMGLAHVAALRSHDSNTKHGCVIVGPNQQILGLGYNGFPRGIDDDYLPNSRPGEDDDFSKYDVMTHAEPNSLANCSINPKMIGGATAYITGFSCNSCLLLLIQNGIHTVKYVEKPGLDSDEGNKRTEIVRRVLVSHSGIKLIPMPLNIEWVKAIFK